MNAEELQKAIDSILKAFNGQDMSTKHYYLLEDHLECLLKAQKELIPMKAPQNE